MHMCATPGCQPGNEHNEMNPQNRSSELPNAVASAAGHQAQRMRKSTYTYQANGLVRACQPQAVIRQQHAGLRLRRLVGCDQLTCPDTIAGTPRIVIALIQPLAKQIVLGSRLDSSTLEDVRDFAPHLVSHRA